MVNTILNVVFGAGDPERQISTTLAEQAGLKVLYAGHNGRQVHPGVAYKATEILDSEGRPVQLAKGTQVLAFECGGPALEGLDVVVIDHHEEGHPGFGRPPSEFLPASSIGQLISQLALRGLVPPQWARVQMETDLPVGSFLDLSQVWYVVTRPDRIAKVPFDAVMAAAGDHCLRHAYAGRCPGVHRGRLLKWRTEMKAAFQKRSPAEILQDIHRAVEELRAAPVIELGRGCYHLLPEGDRPEGWRYPHDAPNPDCPVCIGPVKVRDMRRPTPVPQLPEAAALEGLSYVSGPLKTPDGREKFTVSGVEEAVRAFLAGDGPAAVLEDLDGDPARGFARGYLPAD